MMNRQSVDKQCSGRWIFLLLSALAVTFLGGCSTAPNAEPGELSVRVFVDLDGSTSWNDGDVPLPEITVFVDGDQSGITDQEGSIRFEDVPQGQHTVAIRSEDVEEMTSHSLICDEAAKTVQVDKSTEIGFYFTAKGFMDVDMAEDPQGEQGR